MEEFLETLGKREGTPQIILLVVKGKDYFGSSIRVLKKLLNDNKLSGVYVTVNRPYSAICTSLKNEKIDISKLLFIDTITEKYIGPSDRTSECTFLESPENLTELGIALDQAIQTMPKNKTFIFFDSLGTLLTYNEEDSVNQFAHFLTTKMRSWGVMGILLSLEDKPRDKVLVAYLGPFVDKVVEV